MHNYEERFFITCRFVFASFFFLVLVLFLSLVETPIHIPGGLAFRLELIEESFIQTLALGI